MPFYDYRCRDCDTVFEIRRSMHQEASAEAVTCDACGSTETERVFTALNIAGGSSHSVRETVPEGSACCGPSCGCSLN